MGMSRDQLAATTNLPVSTVVRHESGGKSPTADEMLLYCRALRCTAAEFEQIRGILGRFRGRPESWWRQADLGQADDVVEDLAKDLAKVIRRVALEFGGRTG